MTLKINKSLVIYFVVFEVSLALLFFTGGILGQRWLDRRQPLAILHEAYTILEENAVMDLPPERQLEYGMIRGMLQAYNEPYTLFVEPPQNELQTNQLQGSYGGIGARLEQDAENNWLIYPYPDSPAYLAGIRDGDRLLAIGDLQVNANTPLDDIQAAIRGPVGESVVLAIGHMPDFAPVTVKIKRQQTALPSVTSNLLPDAPQVGIVHVQVMANSTATEITTAIQDLESRGATDFILDLRNNSGGLVNSGVDTARLFLDSGVVIQQQYKGQPVKSYTVEKPGLFANLPLVVLVNHGTASAAEIAAGALQAHHRAPLIGVQTYGKNTIQLVFDLIDHSSLHVTAAHWWVPGLDQFSAGNGLLPDVRMSDEDTQSAAILQAALQNLLQK